MITTRHITYPEHLPVSARRGDICDAITHHQVVIIAGETGSGKTTQIPKMCLDMGLGDAGMIGHTQPRRIAARSVAERIAEELGEKLGQTVGYQVRFTSEVSSDSHIKLMTDGILLAEIQHDPLLKKYSTIIVDEAHERSLNIDFLLGYLKNILPKRPDLKLIITSATIDPQRFAEHFPQKPHSAEDPPKPAPIIEVSGRTYPVEIRYRPLTAPRVDFAQDHYGAGADNNTPENPREDDRDPIDGVVDALDELSQEPPGDVLIFFAGEQEIRDAQEAIESFLKKRPTRAQTHVLPLFGRLSMAEQHKVFTPSPAGHYRIVLATNVAETSLTVPGIKYVIDTGTARISRYSTRTKVQRLPIERISQASAQQRSGRCGRVSDGICIRLYSEEDFAARAKFTDPEILRTNLASVILHMISAGVVRTPADISHFPFVQPPESRAIKDGVALLRELGALRADTARTPRKNRKKSHASPLTHIGRSLAALPVDPRLGRMIVEGHRRGCAREIMVLAAALTVQDPRERPLEKRQIADEHHARFKDKTSDFLGFLLLWRYIQQQQDELSRSAFRRMCAREYLNYLRILEWQDLYQQLRTMARSINIRVGTSYEVDPVGASENIHKSLLSGLLGNIGTYQEKTRDYQGARGTRFAIFPGSDLFKKRPDFIVSAELVETTRLWARTNASIAPEWIEEMAGDLVKRSYAQPHWSRSQGCVMAREKVSLYGVPLIADRPVGYWRVEPEQAREIFIRRALVEGDWDSKHQFVARNRATIAHIEELENRLRRKDLRADDHTLFEFFNARIPDHVLSQRHFDSWWKKARLQDEKLLDFTPEHILDSDSPDWDDAAFPRQWVYPTDNGTLTLDLDYTFAPGDHPSDGVTVRVPVLFLNQLSPAAFSWQIPGLRLEMLTALIKSLPKSIRKNVIPAPDVARQALEVLEKHADPMVDGIETALEKTLRQLRSVIIEPGSWDWSKVPEHLRVRFQVRDAQNKILAEGEDLELLQTQLRDDIRQALAQSLGADPQKLTTVVAPGPASSPKPAPTPKTDCAPPANRWEQHNLTEWPSPDVPRQIETIVAGQKVTGWPALEPSPPISTGAAASHGHTGTINIRVFSTPEEQKTAQRRGTIALLDKHLPSVHRYISEHLGHQEKIVFTQNPHGSVDSLIADCTLAAIDTLVPAEPPWTKVEYTHLFDLVRAELIDTVFTVTSGVARTLAEANTVGRLIKKPGSLAAVAAFSDLQEQLKRLVYPGFVAEAGWENVQHMPRYLHAMQMRVDKLVGTAAVQRDTNNMLTIHALEDELDTAIGNLPVNSPISPALERIEWDLQELRVSFFAQELGTARSVSAQRIRTALRKATV